ncbi:MAG: response regulator [Candidatus Polarisedimenticolaceae bacterium]|nr:response regulator [Candidatus Polarisedimenticolaceae bacterium]
MTSLQKNHGTDATEDDLEQAIASATLLFVDDETNILSSLRRLFRPYGYKILVALGGREGLEMMESNRVDLVISDMRMPEMDGATFLAKVAEQWPETVRILLTGYADIESTIAAINIGKIYKYICKPWDENDIKLSVRHALEQRFLEQERKRLLILTNKQNRELQAFNANLEETVQQRTQELRKTMDMLETAHKSLKSNYVSSIKVFSNIIELREGTSTGHARRVAEWARDLALKLELDNETVQQVLFAALLHNIGKVGLPDKLINKPFNELPIEEQDQVAKHPVIGEGLLMGLDNLQVAAKLIRGQHEHFNGCGYPDKLSGEAIPLGARIIALTNDYDDLLQGMLSRKTYNQSEAQDYLLKNKGKHYDPELVDLFLDMVGITKPQPPKVAMRLIKSNGLTVGMVLAQDLVIQDRALLLSKGHVLNESLIQRIHDLERALNEDLDLYIAE